MQHELDTPEPSLNAFINKFGGWTESYWFYNGTIELRFDPKAHVYYLVNDSSGLEAQDGVTSICHIIDKSEALIPWACKMMAQKLFLTTPTMKLPAGETIVPQMAYADYEALVLTAKTAHKEKLEEAGKVGHAAHDWIEQYIKYKLRGEDTTFGESIPPHPTDPRATNCCVAALDWMGRHSVIWHSTERKIYSRAYKYAGTMDGLASVSSCSDPQCCPHAFTNRLSIIDWKSSNYLYMEYMLQTAAYQHAYEEEMGVTVDDRWVIRLGKDDGEFEPWHMERGCMDEDFSGFLLALELSRSVISIKARIKAKEDNRRAVAKAEKYAAKKEALQTEKYLKAVARANKKLAAEEQLKIRCKGWATYKGTRKPACNGGHPCQSCLEIYALKHPLVCPSRSVGLPVVEVIPATIPVNRARCRICKDVIESIHRHDFVTCKGGHIFIDGGSDYRRSGCLLPGVVFEDIEYLDDIVGSFVTQ